VVLNGEYQYYIKENPANKILVRAEVAPGLTYIHHAINGKKLYMVKAAVEETFQRNDTIYGNCFFYDAVDDASGNVWIGSSKGLVKFNTLRNQIVHYQHDESNTNSVSSDFIYSWKLTIGMRQFGWLRTTAAYAPIGYHPEHSNITARKMAWRIISFTPLKKIIMEISGSAAMPGFQHMM
jgi:hypothetical protein